MAHLGERVTALVDGQLPAEAAERAYAHLACCRACRDLVEAERLAKGRLAALRGPAPAPELFGRLLALGGPTGPLTPRTGHVPGSPRPAVLAPPTVPGAGRPAPGRPTARAVSRRPGPAAPRGSGPGRPSHRRVRLAVVVAGTLVVVGAGVTGLSRSTGGSAPTVVPPVDTFVVDHARSTEDFPFADLSAGWQETAPAVDGGAGR